MSLYKHPQYYDIAFSFRNIPSEVDFFEQAIRKFSKIKVDKVFELASGNSPFLEEWHKRGYKYVGLDSSKEMLDFVRSRAKDAKIEAQFFLEDMNTFSLKGLRVDLSYVSLGSMYATSNNEFLKHLNCVAKTLKTGGLYILDGVVWFNILHNNKQSWTITKSGIKVKTTFRAEILDPVAQTFQERAVLEMNDHGKKKRIESHSNRKFFFPQEFLTLIKLHARFEFLGWFNNFNINQPATVKGRQAVVLRKK